MLWVALGSMLRVYEYLDSARPSRVVAHTFRQCLFGTIAVILFQYFLRLNPTLSRTFLGLFFVYDFALLTLFRWNSQRLIGAFHRGFGTPYHIVLVGNEERTTRLAESLRAGSPFRIQISATVPETECCRTLPRLLSTHIVDEVIFDIATEKLSEVEDALLLCDEEGVRTRIALDLLPRMSSELTLDRLGNAPVLTFSAAPLDEVSLAIKRLFDIVVSAVALIVLSPIAAAAALLIKLTGEGPVIFRQPRCGLNGRRFMLYKFRSMVVGADGMKPDLEHLSEREIAFKLSHDPRVTSIGRWLRKFSIDELPQLWNVLRGDMSIVGPRPPLREEVERYERWQRRRLRMRPGLTCLWAVMGRDRLDFNAWMRTDISYIDNWSLRLDWSIILKTIPHVLAGRAH